MRSHQVTELRGQGLGGVATQHHDLDRFLEDGEILLDPHGLCPVRSS